MADQSDARCSRYRRSDDSPSRRLLVQIKRLGQCFADIRNACPKTGDRDIRSDRGGRLLAAAAGHVDWIKCFGVGPERVDSPEGLSAPTDGGSYNVAT